jgi:putative oxidoreductase
VVMSAVHVLFRISIASIFLRAGLIKIANWPLAVQLFQDDYRVPLLGPSMGLGVVTVTELVSSALILSGFLTRLATLPLLGMIAIIVIFVSTSAWVEHLTRVSILLFLLVRGGGAMSLDHVFGLEEMVGKGRRTPSTGRT